MSREILFKAKCISEKWVWAEGYLVEQNYPDYHAYIFQNINIDKGNKYTDIISHDIIEIDPETVCQYTGLTDRYGRKIFEGDIVSGEEKRGSAFHHCKVVWNDVLARFDVIAMDCSFPMCMNEYKEDISIKGSDYEIIGNIFDNPELLEA